MKKPGHLAIVLHTHMPYVEGFGTWPFGEEWLWEAMASSYLPLLPLLERAPLTLSVTPVLADQLAAPGIGERFLEFCRTLRAETHRRDAAELRARGEGAAAAAVELSQQDYEQAAQRFEEVAGDLNVAWAPHVRWSSSATHAILPLLATDAGIELQVGAGIDSFRQRFGREPLGFWLPECAYSASLNPFLQRANVGCGCIELTNFFGRGDSRHLLPIEPVDGVRLAPIDRETIDLVWGKDGYPAAGAYRDYHHLTTFHHRAWSNDGQVYDRERAQAQVQEHAVDFVERVLNRLEAGADALGQAPLLTFAIDTELFGHWWYEGVDWLAAVIDQAQLMGLEIVYLDQAVNEHEAQKLPETGLPTCSWGRDGDLSTWSGSDVAEIAWQLRKAELEALLDRSPSPRALRELLALQSSDWAFLVSNSMAGEYPQQRIAGHQAELQRQLAIESPSDGGLRNLAPYL